MTRVLAPGDETVAEAARLLKEGRLVAFPTETVYGLGADATSDAAVAAIYRAKGRPACNPLIVHVAGLEEALRLARLDARARRLAARFWPGPLTMVLPRRADCGLSPGLAAGLPSVAIRVPAHPLAHALLVAAGLPVAAPSANPSGRISPTEARHVAEDLGEAVAAVLDGGPCPVGLESTVVDLARPDTAVLLRPGGLPRAAIEELVGPLASPGEAEAPRSPGQLASHYAPRLPVRLDATEPLPGEALLAFGPEVPAGARATRNLSPSGDPGEAARNLFRMLRELDESGATAIAVMPIPAHGLGEAIRDRLRRAAAPRG
ncbi:L-threonylcarbamoyladenylate synthase [Geminicoccaceae bacterium 1502E]|nr:L-threonylcarbamoyladenylate synthase [Geminicoccaceae bacterium 1502E]